MPSGAQAMCNFGYELVAFKTLAASHAKTFGAGVKISTQDAKRNLQRIYGLGSRSATTLVEGRYEGAISIDFELANPWFLQGVMGAYGHSGAGPYSHVFSEADVPVSYSIEADVDLSTNAVIHYLGSLCNECRITMEEGAPAHVAMSFLYATETMATAGRTAQTAETEASFNMGYCSFETPTNTAIADTKRMELTITNNAVLYWGLGSVLAGQYIMGTREYTISTVNFFDDATTYLEKLYGQATGPTVPTTTIATATARATNGLAGVNERTFAFDFTTAKVNSHSLPRDVTEALYETVEIIPQSCTVTVTNNTSIMP